MQSTLSKLKYAAKKRITRRDRLRTDLEAHMPWSRLLRILETPCPTYTRNRLVFGLVRTPRLYVEQQYYSCSDEGAENTLNARLIFNTIYTGLAEKLLLLQEGIIADAAAPSVNSRDAMHAPARPQTKKGNQWYFRIEAYNGLDAESGLVQTTVGKAVDVHDVTRADAPLHGEERAVHYVGVDRCPENLQRAANWKIAMCQGWRKQLPDTVQEREPDQIKQLKARNNAKVEHLFRVLMTLFLGRKSRYGKELGEERGSTAPPILRSQSHSRPTQTVDAEHPRQVLTPEKSDRAETFCLPNSGFRP